MSNQNASEQDLNEAKAGARAAGLFARKGSAKPAGPLIPYERRVETAKDAPAVETAAEDRPPEALGDAGSLLTVIEFRKPTPDNATGARPESKLGPAGKSIAELSDAVSEALGESLGEDRAAQAKPGSGAAKTAPAATGKPAAEAMPTKPPKPDMAPFSKTAKAAPAALRPKLEKPPSAGRAKPTARPAPARETAPKASPPYQRPPRQELGAELPLGLLVLVGVMLAGWLAVTNLGSAPGDGDPAPVTKPESAAPAVDPAAESAPEPAPDAAAPDSAETDAGAAAGAAVEPSFDLIRIEPDGEAVIAGRAAPYAELILLDNGEPIGRVSADWSGEWAFIPKGPLQRGDHQFSLVVVEPQGTVTLPAPEAPEQAGEGDAPATGPAAEDAATAPAGDPGEQSQLAPETAQPAPLPGHKPKREVKAGYFVQLSSVISLDGAQQERDKLQRIFPELLGGMELAVEQAKLDDLSTRYRVRAGLFAAAEPARALCQQLRARSQDCLVIKQ